MFGLVKGFKMTESFEETSVHESEIFLFSQLKRQSHGAVWAQVFLSSSPV
jgi:hypothetical protein